MDDPEIPLPKKTLSDPPRPEQDPIAFAVSRLQTDPIWIHEHYSSFEQLRNTDPANAEQELRWLKGCADDAVREAQRLTDLLLAGCAVDLQKQLPKGLNGKSWLSLVEGCQRRRAR